MFNWFKGRKPAEPKRETRSTRSEPARPVRPRRVAPGSAPLPLPEVVSEGSTEADWSAWEDSMTALDSQMGGLPASNRVHVRETQPSKLDDIDAFSSVRGKRDT
ncbi:MAG TPA: hypothetical protein VHL79_17720 [Ramlibacter sp.]|jgi:hypothetical protein|nr:hypothetical protein [Ramlibacter sp.]